MPIDDTRLTTAPGYAWERELATCDAEYYKWNQYFFLKFYENGLAYRAKAPVNWCDHCQTSLAREQVTSEGTCERCGTEYEFDETLVSDRGTTVKCTNCGHLFKVFRGASSSGGTPAPGAEPKTWTLRTADGLWNYAPRADRPAREIRIALGVGRAHDRAFEAHLAPELVPIEHGRRPAGRQQLAAFARAVVRVEHRIADRRQLLQ